MRLRGWWLWGWCGIGCGGSAGQEPGRERDLPAESGDPGDTGADPGDTDSDDTADPAPAWCPAGMVGVPAEAPVFCAFAYEASLDGDGRPASVEGAIPEVGVTWTEAKAACEALEIRGDAGEALGYAHLITSTEWEDAADGVIGEGGSAWPYGDACDYDLCVTPAEDGSLVWPDMQPTGSMPGCRSAAGVYDQAGNAWEWADPGQTIDSAAWFAARAQDGLIVEEEGGLLVARTGIATDYLIDIAGAANGVPLLDDAGHLCTDRYESHIPPEEIKGFLQAPGHHRGDASDLLPVSLLTVAAGESPLYCVRLLASEDGMPITDKRGGAWYVGNAESYRSDSTYRGHAYDFEGTIGFRCAWRPG